MEDVSFLLNNGGEMNKEKFSEKKLINCEPKKTETITEKNSEFWYTNHEVKTLQESFPFMTRLHSVDRYYPMRLEKKYEDYPIFEIEIDECKKKQSVLKKDYIYIHQGKKYEHMDNCG